MSVVACVLHIRKPARQEAFERGRAQVKHAHKSEGAAQNTQGQGNMIGVLADMPLPRTSPRTTEQSGAGRTTRLYKYNQDKALPRSNPPGNARHIRALREISLPPSIPIPAQEEEEDRRKPKNKGEEMKEQERREKTGDRREEVGEARNRTTKGSVTI